MGKGGYNGGSTVIRAAVGFVKSKPSSAGWKAKRKKIKRKVPGFNGHLTLAEARSAGLNQRQWQAQATARVSAIEKQIMGLKSELVRLEQELRLAAKAKQEAFKVVDSAKISKI